MWKTLAFTAAKIGLGLLAPGTGGVLGDIKKVAEVALPIVEKVAINNPTTDNDTKWDTAVNLTQNAISGMSRFAFDEIPSNHIIDSGVQLAYSLFKGKQ